jgi:hypothetical protein
MIYIESCIKINSFLHSSGFNPEGFLNNTNLKFEKYDVMIKINCT